MEYLTNKFETDKDLLKFKLGREWNKTSLEFIEKKIKTLDKLANKTLKKLLMMTGYTQIIHFYGL